MRTATRGTSSLATLEEFPLACAGFKMLRDGRWFLARGQHGAAHFVPVCVH